MTDKAAEVVSATPSVDNPTTTTSVSVSVALSHNDPPDESEIAEREALLKLLTELGIEFEQHMHTPAYTVETLHECVAPLMSESVLPCKNLYCKSKKSGREVLMVLSSSRKVQLNDESVRTFGLDKKDNLRFATSELMKQRLHAKQGALNAFCIRFAARGTDSVELWVGRELLAAEFWLVHPMTNDASLKIRTADMLKFFDSVGAKVNAF
jgi:hypothetical protein